MKFKWSLVHLQVGEKLVFHAEEISKVVLLSEWEFLHLIDADFGLVPVESRDGVEGKALLVRM